ncbi:MAG: TlyA family RNA methyltransferase [Turneriella sp.]|nr:TlyA family RNA methyltransferase [Turneriella sp.]
MRLAEALVRRKLAKDAHEATGLIMAGKVLVNGQPVTKTGFRVSPHDQIRLRGVKRFASRAAAKLEAAILAFNFPVAGRVFLDIGAASGGFTEILLRHGAKHVIAVDVGRNLIDFRLRSDPRVELWEGTDIRKLNIHRLKIAPEAFVADISFNSLRRILPHAMSMLRPLERPKEGIVLFKPQFELPRSERHLLQKGILSDPDRIAALLAEFAAWLQEQACELKAQLASPIKGRYGNQEFLLHIQSSLPTD